MPSYKAGETQSSPIELALFLKLSHPGVVRALTGGGLISTMILDAEHGAFSDGDLELLCEVLKLSSCQPVVRVPMPDAMAVARALDRGASGIMLPRVTGVADTTEALRGLTLAPTGARGWDPTVAANGYGARPARSSAGTRCFVQIETLGALREAEGIAQLEGVTDLFVGPADLARAMGGVGQVFTEEVMAAAEALAHRVKGYPVRLGLFVDSPERASWALALGYSFLAIGSDVGILAAGARRAADFTPGASRSD